MRPIAFNQARHFYRPTPFATGQISSAQAASAALMLDALCLGANEPSDIGNAAKADQFRAGPLLFSERLSHQQRPLQFSQANPRSHLARRSQILGATVHDLAMAVFHALGNAQ